VTRPPPSISNCDPQQGVGYTPWSPAGNSQSPEGETNGLVSAKKYLPEVELNFPVPLRVTSKEDVVSVFQTTVVAACALMEVRKHANRIARLVLSLMFSFASPAPNNTMMDALRDALAIGSVRRTSALALPRE
jgi:hypothetical protein